MSSAPTSTVVVCAHCALAVPAGLVEPAAPLQFCCAGCRAVYNTIHACGLDAYYAMRADADVVLAGPASPGGRFDAFDGDSFRQLYCASRSATDLSIDLVLEGVTCGACVWLVEKLPEVLPGVIESRLSLREGTVRVRLDPTRVRLSQVAAMLDRLGYRPHPAKGVRKRDLQAKASRQALVDIGLSGAIMGNMMLLGAAMYAGWTGGMEDRFSVMFRWISLVLGVVSLAVPGRCFWISSWRAVRNRTVNLDMPITLALLAGGAAGVVNVVLNRGEIYFDSLSVLVFLLLVGRYFQARQQRRADDAVELLFSFTPGMARRVREPGSEAFDEVPVEALLPDDVVEVWPGELFCADGRIVDGRSNVDQALLTGESELVPVREGQPVLAGSMNVGSALRVRVEQIGRETRVGKLMDLVERGVNDKPQAVLFADTVGRYFLPAVCALGAVTFAIWLFAFRDLTGAIDHTVAFLIVTCPCVLGLATPLTLAVATGQLARRGILVKSAVALEKLAARRGSLLLDKTGTITEGRLRLVNWVGDPSLQPVVAEIEKRSTHPVARALVDAFGDRELSAEQRITLTDVRELGDGGITARWDGQPIRVGSMRFMLDAGVVVPRWMIEQTIGGKQANVALVAVGPHVVAGAVLGDRVRADSADAIAWLSNAGWAASIVTGDHRAAAMAVATQVGVDERSVRSQVAPEEKLEVVKHAVDDRGQRPAASRRTVVMIGDGVNDAAALAAADVGIAVEGGAEASLAAADVYVARPGLTPVADLVDAARHTMHVVRRNFVITLGYNVLAGALAATGVMNPLVAAILMPLSSATTISTAVWSVTRRRSTRPTASTRDDAVPMPSRPTIEQEVAS